MFIHCTYTVQTIAFLLFILHTLYMVFLHCTVKLYEPSPTLTVEETADRQLAKVDDRKKRAAETRRRRKADRA